MKFWAKRQTQLHHSLNQMAHSSQNLSKLRYDMPATNVDTTQITDQIIKYNYFEFCKVSMEEVKKVLLSINNDKPPGSDNLNGKLLRIIADNIATPISHIFNLSLLESLCPQAWREAKIIRLHKISKAPFTGSNSQPGSLLPTFSKHQIKSNCICHMRQIQPYSGMLTYKPLTNNAVLTKSPQK